MAPRFAFDPPDAGDDSQYRPTLDDILLVVLAIATVLGALILIGLSSMSAVSRLEAAISRLASSPAASPNLLPHALHVRHPLVFCFK